MLLPPFQRCAPSRQDRPYLPLVLLACVLLLLYIQPRRPDWGLTPPIASTPTDVELADWDAVGTSVPISSASLESLSLKRLRELLNQPILDYDSSLALESLRCPDTHLQTNRDQLRNEGELFWNTVTTSELAAARARMVERVQSRFGWGGLQEDLVSDDGVQGMLGTGRGLVFTAGKRVHSSKDTATRLLTSLRILRKHHNCSLPAEIFVFSSELAALGQVKRDIDALGGVTWRTTESERSEGAWKQFGIKGDAIARSGFAEILYLDSDNIPLVDPSFLFDSTTYKQYGIVLWPDFNRDSAANPVWRLLGHHCSPAEAWQAESGQLLVNKRARHGLNLVALEVARAMMREDEFWFRLSGGDKDIFRFAFLSLALPFAMAPHYPSALGGPSLGSRSYKGHTFCGHSMVQYGLDARQEWAHLRSLGLVGAPAGDGDGESHAPPLFVHANVLKHTGYAHKRGTTFTTLKRPVDDFLFGKPQDTARLRWPAPPVPLAAIRQIGLPVHGICVDLWDASARQGAREQVEGAEEGAYEEGAVSIESWAEAWHGLGRGLDDLYYDQGGVAGAW